jgi:hypothetical protein
MESSHTAELDIPELNAAASKAHVLPGMANHSLLSVGQLCDEGYIVTFKQAAVTICDSGNSQILSGPQNLNTRLWRIDLKQTNNHTPEPTENNVYELHNTGTLVHYLHKALFSPTKSAMLQAVKDGHLITWPGLTEDAINKNLKLTPDTAMGHMNQLRQNIRSTSKATIEKQPTPDTDLGTKTHLVYAVVVDQGQLYIDLTGKFPVRSSKGNSYVMVCYVYDCNYVKVIPMKSRSASEWVKSYDTVHQELTVKGFKPKLQTLANEASTALKTLFTVNDIAYQLVPPHCHRRNAAERAMRTFKEHFVAGLYSVDPSFPLHLWDRLLPQAEITLNILRTLRLHPYFSAAAHFHGLVDNNKTAFAPPGCTIIAHEKPGKRRSLAPHGQHGYSLGPAMHYYRCQNIYISTTASGRIVDTLEFFPHNYQMPQLSSTDRLLMAANDMPDALQNPHPEVPFASVRDDTISALADLAAIFRLKLQQTPSPTPQAVPPPAFQHPILSESSTQILNSPMPISQQTRSQTKVHTQDIPNVPLPPRVITPRTLRPSPPRVPTRSWRLSPQLVSRRLLRNGHSPHDHRPWRQPLVTSTPSKPRHPPRHRKRYGIIGTHEGSPSTTTLDARIWQRMRTPLPRHSRHSWNRYMFLHQTKNIPKDRNITYNKIVCDYKPHKKEKECVRLTVGGDRLDYSGDVATSTADITTFKILINSTLSTEDAAMMTMEI